MIASPTKVKSPSRRKERKTPKKKKVPLFVPEEDSDFLEAASSHGRPLVDDDDEEENDGLDQLRTMRVERQERTNLRQQLNRTVSGRIISTLEHRNCPERSETWESDMMSNLMGMSAITTPTESKNKKSSWDVPDASSFRKAAAISRNRSGFSSSLTTPNSSILEEEEESSNSEDENDKKGINIIQPYSPRKGFYQPNPSATDQDETETETENYLDENDEDSYEGSSSAQKAVARSVKRCNTTDWNKLVGGGDETKSLKKLEQNHWWGSTQPVVVAVPQTKTTTLTLGSINEEESSLVENESGNKDHRSVSCHDDDESSQDLQSQESSSFEPATNSNKKKEDDTSTATGQQPRGRIPPARTRTGMLKDAFQKIMTVTSLEWNENCSRAPQEEVGAGHERTQIRSSQKTKKDESIAAASVPTQHRPKRRSSCKFRGRRAVDAWRRDLRHKKQRQKRMEENRYAFNLEFDPFALKPVAFDTNVFRGGKDTSSDDILTPADDAANFQANFANAASDHSEASPTEDVHDDVSAMSQNWHRDMENMLAASPRHHRKKFLARAQF